MTACDAADLDRIFREEFGQTVATLVGVFGDVDLAEDAAQEAFAAAARTWPERGLPPNPGGWLTTTARRRAIDRLRREATRDDRHAQAMLLREQAAPQEGAMGDDRLRLIFTCCHPALSMEARVALTLRLLGGLTTQEIARSFLVSHAAMEQRIVRAKRKIRANNLPYRIPEDHELPGRLNSVLAVIYLVFNEGYFATSGAAVTRRELSDEAIRLARMLTQLMPDEPEARGLLALLLLTEARRAARTSPTGDQVLLAEQDRSTWDTELIREGQGLVRSCLRRDQPGPYQFQAAINAVHCDAPTMADTDWPQIVTLYDQWIAIAPTAVVRLNRAIAVAEVDGAASGLELLDELADQLEGHQPFHVARAELLQRIGRNGEAAVAYDQAATLTNNLAVRRSLDQRRADLPPEAR